MPARQRAGFRLGRKGGVKPLPQMDSTARRHRWNAPLPHESAGERFGMGASRGLGEDI